MHKIKRKGNKKLIRRWDSERELFYDDILHVLQSTIDSCRNSGTDIGHTVFTLNRKQQETVTTVKQNLDDKLQVSNSEIHPPRMRKFSYAH